MQSPRTYSQWKAFIPGVLIFALGAFLGELLFRLPAPREKYSQERAATVKVKRGNGYGSGVLIRRLTIDTHQPRLFMWTAKHVVGDAGKVSVIRTYHLMRGTRGVATEVTASGVVIFRAGCDAALVSVEAPPELFGTVEFDLTDYPVGTEIFHVGNLLGDFDTSLTRGVISQKDVNRVDSEGWPWELVDQTDLVICPGSSGGPVFSSRGVIGLVGGGPSQGLLGIACYIPVRVIVIDAKQANMQWAIFGGVCPSDKTIEDLAAREAKANPPKVEFPLLIVPAPSATPKQHRLLPFGKRS